MKNWEKIASERGKSPNIAALWDAMEEAADTLDQAFTYQGYAYYIKVDERKLCFPGVDGPCEWPVSDREEAEILQWLLRDAEANHGR